MSSVDNQLAQIGPQIQDSRGYSRREALRRVIRNNEEHLLVLIPSTAAARLILERRGARTFLPENVLRADRRATSVLSERLTAIENSRGTANSTSDLTRYNQDMVRTIRLFHIYREFQLWQASLLPDDVNTQERN